MDSYNAFEEEELLNRIFTPLPYNKFHNISIDLHNENAEEKNYLQKILTLYALVPNIFTRETGYSFQAQSNEEGLTTLKYCLDDSNTDELCHDFIDLWQDEIKSLISARAIDAEYNPTSNSFTFYNTESLQQCLEYSANEMSYVSKPFSEIVLSSAYSIYSELLGPDNLPRDEDITVPHQAITKGLNTVVSAFSNASELQVIPLHYKGTEICKIDLGKNTPVSYEKRFQALREIYDLLDASIGDRDGLDLQYAPDEAEVAVLIYNPALASRFISRLYDDLDIANKTAKNKATMFISAEKLLEACHQPEKAKLQHAAPYMH